MGNQKNLAPESVSFHVRGVNEYFKTFGAGVAGSHDVLVGSGDDDDDIGFAGDSDNYVYAIEMYTDNVNFDTLEEDGVPVSSHRLDVDYPKGAVITGRFTAIEVAGDGVVGIFKITVP